MENYSMCGTYLLLVSKQGQNKIEPSYIGKYPNTKMKMTAKL